MSLLVCHPCKLLLSFEKKPYSCHYNLVFLSVILSIVHIKEQQKLY